MMGELVARNLLHRPMRTFIGVMAVAVEVALVVLIVGLTSGLLTETAKRIEGIGAAGDHRMQGEPDFAGDRYRIDGQMRHRGVAAPTLDPDRPGIDRG